MVCKSQRAASCLAKGSEAANEQQVLTQCKALQDMAHFKTPKVQVFSLLAKEKTKQIKITAPLCGTVGGKCTVCYLF